MNYSKFSIQQNKKFKSGLQRVIDNRKDWEYLKSNVKSVYNPLLKELKENFKFEFFYLSFSEDYFDKKEFANQNFIQISMGKHPMGIIKKIKDENTDRSGSELLSEKGGTLSFSQGPQGEVMIIIYSCKSEVYNFEDEFIIYGIYSSPNKITAKKLKKIIKFYFKFMYITSFVGKVTYIDRLQIMFIKLRSKFDLLKFGQNMFKVFQSLINLRADIKV